MDNSPITKQELLDALQSSNVALKQELKPEFEALRNYIDQKVNDLGDELKEFSRDVETKLLTAFHGYGRGQASRMHELEQNEHMADVRHRDMQLRMAALEDRMLNLETHRR